MELLNPSHLGIDICESWCSCCRKVVHRSCNSNGKGSSQLVLISQSSCKKILAFTKTGAIRPRGSYSRAISEAITLFVSVDALDVEVAEKWKVSVLGCQTIPRIFDKFESISTVGDVSSSKLGNTSGQLLFHFCSGNLPASQS